MIQIRTCSAKTDAIICKEDASDTDINSAYSLLKNKVNENREVSVNIVDEFNVTFHEHDRYGRKRGRSI